MVSRRDRLLRTKSASIDPINENEQQVENENERAENNSINSNESPAEEHKEEVLVNENESNTITTQVKYIAVPIWYIHEQIEADRIKLQKIDTRLNIADSGTKPNPSPTHFRQYDWAIGVRFYPPESSEHYKLLELHKFIKSPYAKTSKNDNKENADESNLLWIHPSTIININDASNENRFLPTC